MQNMPHDDISGLARLEMFSTATLNILEDFDADRRHFRDTQSAIINILDDASAEKERMNDLQTAILNLLEDFNSDRKQLRDSQKAVVNMLEDAADEQDHLDNTHRAVVNILEDFSHEKEQLEAFKTAILNILEDFDLERERAEATNRDLGAAVSSLQTANDAVERSNSELDAFSYSVAHDLRAPLRAMHGFSQALRDEYADKLDDQARNYLDRIQNASKHMGTLIDDLLRLSRVTRTELNVQPVDLTVLIRKLLTQLEETEPERHVELCLQQALTTIADPHLIEIALENLLSNAWKFTGREERATIEVGTEQRDGRLWFYIRDNGAGFDMEYVDKLFRPFQRLHKATEFKGTGIGLVTVARIIQRHGGDITIDSVLDQGTTVHFTLQGG